MRVVHSLLSFLRGSIQHHVVKVRVKLKKKRKKAGDFTCCLRAVLLWLLHISRYQKKLSRKSGSERR